MAISKVILDGDTIMDVTDSTTEANKMLSGIIGYKADGTKATGSITNGSATPAASISGTSASKTITSNSITLTKTISNTPQVSAGYIASGTAGDTSVSLTSPLITQSGSTVTPTTSSQRVVLGGTYVTGDITVNAMPTGTAGTPTATKGSVSNHSVSVTPSVTNTTGYITGGAKTGTAVTVSASELVSGSETKTVNGTYDVTNLAELVVNVSGGGGGDTWSWMGRNPVKVTTLPVETLSFTDLGFNDWTYSTSASTLRSAQDYTTTTTCDLVNYDYITVTSVKVHYEYDSSWAGTVAPTDFAFWYVIATYRYILSYSAAMSGTPEYNSADNTMSQYRLITRNSKYGTYAYGLYSSMSPGVTLSSKSSTTPTVTWKKPDISARGSSTYFSETAYNNLDFDNSYYELTTEIWRVDAGTSDKGTSMSEVYNLLGIS